MDKTNSVLIEIIEIGFFRVKLPEIDLFELQSDQLINYPPIISEPSAVNHNLGFYKVVGVKNPERRLATADAKRTQS